MTSEMEARAEIAEARLAYADAAIQRVRDLHVREIHVNRKGEHPYCDHCTHDDDWELTGYPCSTIRALDGPDGVKCPKCGCELAYPTAVHLVDCGEQP